MKLNYYCMDNPEHVFSGKNLDGIRCPYCDGMVNSIPVSNEVYEHFPDYYELKKIFKQSNEIEITMTNVNEPPKIKLNGKEIEGIVEFDYKYVTENAKPGYHNFFVKYCDKETNTVRTVSANKLMEG